MSCAVVCPACTACSARAGRQRPSSRSYSVSTTPAWSLADSVQWVNQPWASATGAKPRGEATSTTASATPWCSQSGTGVSAVVTTSSTAAGPIRQSEEVR